jgi:uncharacterized glyoxalase superfamily protein PhnB
MKAMKFIRSNPHLPVKNLRQTLDYYRDTLGFYDEWTWTNKDGYTFDGGIRRDEMRLLFGEDPNYKASLSIMWFVENIDEIFAEFQTRGIEFADTLRTHPYGLREFCFFDVNGYCIRVAEGVDE